MEDNRTPITLRLAAGFFTEASAKGAPTRWKTGDKVRWKNGQIEKLGGWVEQELDREINGVARALHEWTSLDGDRWIAVGTNTKLYLINRDTLYDITPLRRSAALMNPFTTTMGSALVLVTDAGHGASEGDSVTLTSTAAVGGLTISGGYTVVAPVTATTYFIVASSMASSAAVGGGMVQASYEIPSGAASETPALGYGACGYGESTYGTPRDPSCSELVDRIRIWSLDNFGEDLIASPRGGAVYHWDRTLGPLSRAVQLTGAPATNERVLVSNSGGRIICLGAFDTVANASDPMFIVAGAEESLTEFTIDPEGQNDVFEERLAVGSGIIAGVRTRAGVYISTDEAKYLMSEDPSEIFRIVKVAEGDPVIGPNGMIEVGGTTYEMSPYKFLTFDGVLDELPCEVWQDIFSEVIEDSPNPNVLDRTQLDKVYCWYNEKFSEIWWHYPSAGGDGENNRYVVFNKQERCWYFGSIDRTAMRAPGPSYDLPFGFQSGGTFYLHETGVNDGTAPMICSAESHDAQLGDGKNQMQVSRAIPDLTRFMGSISLYLKAKEWPRDSAYRTKGPYTITTATRKKGVKIKGRQIAVRFETSTLGDDWRMGDWVFYAAQDAEGA